MTSQLNNPSQWTTGSEPPTSKQKAFLSTLASAKDVPPQDVDPESLTKSEASINIDQLKNAPDDSNSKNPSETTKNSTAAGGAGSGGEGGQGQGGGAKGDPIQHPDTWTTGNDKATGKQTGYIAAMAREAGQEVETGGMGKSEASKVIGELKEKTGM